MQKIIYLLIFLLIGNNIYSQISDHTTPASFNKTISSKSSIIIPSSVLDSVKADEQISYDEKNGIPNRIGVIENLEIDIKTQGVKTEAEGINIWQYKISCPDASSLGVFFSTYFLPPGAGVYIYSPDKTRLFGAFTSDNNKENQKLSLAPLEGDELIIEYNEPNDAMFQGELVMGSVSKLYRFIEKATATFIDINCEEGDDWQTEKKAVCKMYFIDGNYAYVCTGSLVNNVREDQTPYFLTANHCISSSSVASTLVTYFNYENSTCNGSDASEKQSLSGASLKATNTYTDFTLLLLSETPPDAYTPYYAGWDASTTSPTSGTCIHHPGGDPKSIAIDNDAPVSYPYRVQWDGGITTSANTHWETDYDAGADAGGSSGSSLFDENKRVIGQLHGGDDDISLFGKISLSWNYSSLNSAQLKAWLDPDRTGTLVLDGLDYSHSPKSDFTSDVTIACINTPVYLTDKSTSSPTKWLWSITPNSYEFINETNETSQNPVIKFTADGSYSVSLTASNEYGEDLITYENLISVTSALDVNFTDFSEETVVCGVDLDNYQITAEGANSYEFEISEPDFIDMEIDSETISLTLTDAGKENGSFDATIKVTGSHGECTDSDEILLHIVMPDNDDIEDAIFLKLGKNGYYTNKCASVEDNEPSPSSFDKENTIWFSFMGTTSGMVTIETEGFDTQIAVYKADSYSDIISGNSSKYTILTYNDNYSTSQTASKIENLSVNYNQKYWLQVNGKNGDYGDLTIYLLSNSIEIYPNPSDGIFHITVGSVEDGTAYFSVFNINGQHLLTQQASFNQESNTMDLDLSDFATGVYVLRVEINGVNMTRKLIVK